MNSISDFNRFSSKIEKLKTKKETNDLGKNKLSYRLLSLIFLKKFTQTYKNEKAISNKVTNLKVQLQAQVANLDKEIEKKEPTEYAKLRKQGKELRTAALALKKIGLNTKIIEKLISELDDVVKKIPANDNNSSMSGSSTSTNEDSSVRSNAFVDTQDKRHFPIVMSTPRRDPSSLTPVDELITTEQTFLDSLAVTREIFKNLAQARDLTRNQKNIIDQINFRLPHTERAVRVFFEKLQSFEGSPDAEQQIADLFESDFYDEYCQRLLGLVPLINKGNDLKDVFIKQFGNQLFGHDSASTTWNNNNLTIIIQRVTRQKLLLISILDSVKKTNEGAPPNLDQVIQKVDKVIKQFSKAIKY